MVISFAENRMLILIAVNRASFKTLRSVPKLGSNFVKVCFSTNPTPDEQHDPNAQSSVVDKVRAFAAKNSRNVAIGGSVFAAALLTRGFYGLTYSFLSLTPYQSMYYGFVGGILATGTTAGLLYISDRSFSINPDRAVRAAMSIIYKNQELRTILGSGIKAGPTKTYTSAYGGFGLKGWSHPEIQAVFPVQGSGGDALVSVVYRKKGLTSEVLEYVGLEYVDKLKTGNNVKLLLKGDESHFTIKNPVKQLGAAVTKKYLH